MSAQRSLSSMATLLVSVLLCTVGVGAVTIDGGASSTGSTTVALTFSPPSTCVSIYAQNSDGSGAYLPACTSPQPWTLATADGVKTVTLTFNYTYQYVCGQYQCGTHCCHWDTWGNCDGYCPTYCDQYCTAQTSYQESATILLTTHSSNSTVAFASPTALLSGPGPRAVARGDFNRDGRVDLAVANTSGSGVSVLLGNGEGTFQTAVPYPVLGSSPLAIAVADLNRDGIADLVSANNGSSTGSILLGVGDGTFQGATTVSAGSGPTGVVVGDFNRDGKPDLAFSCYNSYTVAVLLGYGDGTFQGAYSFGVAGATTGLAAGDFNGDGILDLVSANYGSNNVSVLRGNGDGSFAGAVNYSVGNAPFSVSAGDYDGDGKPDLFTANYGSNSVSVLKGKADGTFNAAFSYGTGSSPRVVLPWDFDRDGRLDLAVTYSGGGVTALRGYENGTFTPASFPTGTDPWGLVAADFDGDGKPDLAAASAGSGTVSLLLNTGVLEPAGAFDSGPDNTVTADAVALVAGDFNRDGNLDLAASSAAGHGVSLLLGRGDGTFQAAIFKDVGSPAGGLAAGDFNRDGKLDLAVARPPSGSVAILFGNGDGTFAYGPIFGANFPEPKYLAVGDFDRDGWPDLVVSHTTTFGQLSFYRNSGGSFSPLYNQSVGYTPGPLQVADFDRNGTLDVSVLNTGSNNAGVWVNCGGTGCDYWMARDVGSGPIASSPGDFNRDGKIDLAVANGGGTNLSVLLGYGNGGFQPAVPHTVGSDPRGIAAEDFNRDGKDDLGVSGAGTCSLAILAGAGDGTFSQAVPYEYGAVSALVYGDFNKDGKMDLAGILGADTVRIFPNVNAFSALTVTRAGSGGGTVVSAPDGIDCGTGCTASFGRSSEVTLTAAPDSGSIFQGWTGDCASCGTSRDCTVTMGPDKSCTATFLSDPVAYWAFDDDTARDWVGTHHGTITGPGVSFAAGKVGRAISFSNGASFVKVPGFNLGKITVSAWVYSSKSGYYTSMVTKNYYAGTWASPYQAWQLWFNENTAAPSFQGNVIGGATSPETVPMNQWVFLAATYDGTTIKLYVNGVLKSLQTSPTPGDMPTSTGDIYIGRPEYSNHSYLGMLDEVALWDRALTAQEIVQQYQSGLAGQGYPVKTFAVTASAAGNGAGTVSCGAGALVFDYPGVGAATTAPIREGTTTAVAATAGPGASASWNGTCTSTGGVETGDGTDVALCTFGSLNADKTISATFTGKAGEASKAGVPMTLAKAAGSSVTFTYTPAGCATDHALYWGLGAAPLSGLAFTHGQCGLGMSGQATVDPGDPDAGSLFYFVIVGNNGAVEGSYGKNSSGSERPESSGVAGCNIPQDVGSTCD